MLIKIILWIYIRENHKFIETYVNTVQINTHFTLSKYCSSSGYTPKIEVKFDVSKSKSFQRDERAFIVCETIDTLDNKAFFFSFGQPATRP